MSVEHTKEVMESYWSGRVADSLAEDVVFTDIASGRRWEGRFEVEEMLRSTYRESFEADFVPEKTHIADGSAAIEGRFVGKHVGEFAGVPGTGRSVDIPLAVFYAVDERGITEGRVWFMLSRFLEQVA